MKINFVDLHKQYQSIKPEIDLAIKTSITQTDFILGGGVELFERSFAKFCQVKYAVGVASGTDALFLSLKALSIGTGDEVITQANTFIASAYAISMTGAIPVLVDVSPQTYNLDANTVEKAITKKTKAILPVHLYGQATEMKPLLELAKKYKLHIIEDACQAHGALSNRKKVGGFGIAAAFSFYPGKNLGAYGDAGAITTNNSKLYKKILKLRNYGQAKKYHHLVLGYNSRLDTLQARILSVKLKYLNRWNRLRVQHAKLYSQKLAALSSLVITPLIGKQITSVYHLYVLQVKKRNQLLKFLNDHGINAIIHYPIPIHLQPAYKNLNYKKGDFPVTEHLCQNIISLPMYPELTNKEIEYTCQTIADFYQK